MHKLTEWNPLTVLLLAIALVVLGGFAYSIYQAGGLDISILSNFFANQGLRSVLWIGLIVGLGWQLVTRQIGGIVAMLGLIAYSFVKFSTDLSVETWILEITEAARKMIEDGTFRHDDNWIAYQFMLLVIGWGILMAVPNHWFVATAILIALAVGVVWFATQTPIGKEVTGAGEAGSFKINDCYFSDKVTKQQRYVACAGLWFSTGTLDIDHVEVPPNGQVSVPLANDCFTNSAIPGISRSGPSPNTQAVVLHNASGGAVLVPTYHYSKPEGETCERARAWLTAAKLLR